ncbi:MAG: hypothetical protein ACPG4K_00210 [Haloferula sp.]
MNQEDGIATPQQTPPPVDPAFADRLKKAKVGSEEETRSKTG